MFILAEETQLSLEKLGKLLGVSGMTLRRWRRQKPDSVLPSTYERSFSCGIEQMVVDGTLSPESKLARSVMSKSRRRSFQAALKSLGFSPALLEGNRDPNDRLMLGLSQIANDLSRVKKVDRSWRLISRLSRMGEEWKRRIEGLKQVIFSPRLGTLDKLVAYGALFYLVTPFDLIPDDIPVFGYLDDFAILGLALAFYMKRFPQLLERGGVGKPARSPLLASAVESTSPPPKVRRPKRTLLREKSG